jgi:predicted RNase H-like HicB family nuclease
MDHAIVIERSDTGFGAYVPELPGCVAVAESEAEVRQLIRQAIELHLDEAPVVHRDTEAQR